MTRKLLLAVVLGCWALPAWGQVVDRVTPASLGLSTSAGLRGALSDENGTGAALFDGASGATLDAPEFTGTIQLLDASPNQWLKVDDSFQVVGTAAPVQPAPVMLFDSSTGAMVAYGSGETDPADIGTFVVDAKTAAASGDTVYVSADFEINANLAKTGVNWALGDITVTSQMADGEAIFADGGAAMVFNVSGRANFVFDNGDDEGGQVLSVSGASTINFECQSSDGDSLAGFQLSGTGSTVNLALHDGEIDGGGNLITATAGTNQINLGQASVGTGAAIRVSGGTANVVVEGPINSASGECIGMTGGTATIRSTSLVGAGAVECIGWEGGDLTVDVSIISAVNSSTGTVRATGTGSGTLRIVGAKITNTHASIGAINIPGTVTGTKVIELHDCSLVSAATNGITSTNARTVLIHGALTTDKPAEGTVTLTYLGKAGDSAALGGVPPSANFLTIVNDTFAEMRTAISAIASADINSTGELAAITDYETGSGALVFATSPTFVTPVLGTPASGNLTSCTGTRFPIHLACNATTLVDGATHYFGAHHSQVAVQSDGGWNRYYAAVPCTINKAYLEANVSGVLGTSETATIYLRKNSTTDSAAISAAVTLTATRQNFSNTSLTPFSLAAGDYIEAKAVCPTYATNPTGVFFSLTLEAQAQ